MSDKFKVPLQSSVWRKVYSKLLSAAETKDFNRYRVEYPDNQYIKLPKYRLHGEQGSNDPDNYRYSIPHLIEISLYKNFLEKTQQDFPTQQEMLNPEFLRQEKIFKKFSAYKLPRGLNGKVFSDYLRKMRSDHPTIWVDIRILQVVADFIYPDEPTRGNIDRLLRSVTTEGKEWNEQNELWKPISLSDFLSTNPSSSRLRSVHRFSLFLASPNIRTEDHFRLLQGELLLEDYFKGGKLSKVSARATIPCREGEVEFTGETNIEQGTDNSLILIDLRGRVHPNSKSYFCHICIQHHRNFHLRDIKAAFFRYSSFTDGATQPTGLGLLERQNSSTDQSIFHQLSLLSCLTKFAAKEIEVPSTYIDKLPLAEWLENMFPVARWKNSRVLDNWYEVFLAMGFESEKSLDSDDPNQHPGLERNIAHISKTGAVRLFTRHRNRRIKEFVGWSQLNGTSLVQRIRLNASTEYTIHLNMRERSENDTDPIVLTGIVAGKSSSERIIGGRVYYVQILGNERFRDLDPAAFTKMIDDFEAESNENSEADPIPKYYPYRHSSYHKLLKIGRYDDIIPFLRGEHDQYIQDALSIPSQSDIELDEHLGKRINEWTIYRTRTDPALSRFIKMIPLKFLKNSQAWTGYNEEYRFSNQTRLYEYEGNLVINVMKNGLCIGMYVFRIHDLTDKKRGFTIGLYISFERHFYPIAGKCVLQKRASGVKLESESYLEEKNMTNDTDRLIYQYLTGQLGNFNRLKDAQDTNDFVYRDHFFEYFKLLLANLNLKREGELDIVVQVFCQVIFDTAFRDITKIGILLSTTKNSNLLIERLFTLANSTKQMGVMNLSDSQKAYLGEVAKEIYQIYKEATGESEEE